MVARRVLLEQPRSNVLSGPWTGVFYSSRKSVSQPERYSDKRVPIFPQEAGLKGFEPLP